MFMLLHLCLILPSSGGLKDFISISLPESRQLQLERLRELYAKAQVIESTTISQLDD
jgi:hypothetical protein